MRSLTAKPRTAVQISASVREWGKQQGCQLGRLILHLKQPFCISRQRLEASVEPGQQQCIRGILSLDKGNVFGFQQAAQLGLVPGGVGPQAELGFAVVVGADL